MNNPLVSIIVPVYNAEKYLHRCVDSLINQTLHDIEIILIDDGSTDNSGQLCDNYAQQDERIRVFHRTNSGVGSTRHFGMLQVTGLYTIQADSDDWLELDMLEKLYLTAEKEQADMTICDYIEVDDHNNYIEQKPVSLEAQSIIASFFSYSNYLVPCSWNKLIRTACWQQYGLNYEEGINYGEDTIFNIQLLNNNIKVAYCPNTAYHYDLFSNDISYTRTITTEMLSQRVRYFKLVRKYRKIPLIEDNALGIEGQTAFMALRINAYTPKDFYSTFSHIKNVSPFSFKNIPFHYRFILWTAFHINYHAAELMIKGKYWYRQHIKKIKN